ncbi:MAG: SDR family NAD(P)-dependent oxidoreductase, partial [Alphaproteobacteria bacterium]
MTSHPKNIALVTGAATRIGAAIARRLASVGYAVIVHHRSKPDEAEALAADIRATGARAGTVQSDLAERPQRARTIADAAAHFGPLTLLMNNASSFERDSARDLDEQLWDQHFAIHAEAPAFLARDFAAQLPPDTKGNII